MSTLEPHAGPRLRELEGFIERGRKAFVEVGLALMEIRDRRLYKERGYKSFNDYTTEHLGFQRAYAGHLIQGAQAAAEVATNVATLAPVNEGQARELAQAPEGTRVGVMEAAYSIAEQRERPVSAAIIHEVVHGEEPTRQSEPCPHCGGTGWVVA